ncbi:MAG: phage holin family protein [Mariniphaga sp.]
MLTRILISTISIMVVGYLLPGVVVSSVFSAFVVAVVLALLNSIIRPVLIILTLPVTIVTLGLFLLVINGFIVLIANHFVRGFSVSGLFTAIIFSILVSLINAVLGMNSSKKSRN